VNRRNAFLLLGLLLSLVLAGVVSSYASSSPDGLEKVAQDKGFIGTAEDHALSDSPLADYGQPAEGDGIGTPLAGVLGVGITFAFGLGLFALVKRRGRAPAEDEQVDA
jgi:hypothetical protein